MKCPKCQYFSFDSGDRCRNCGYDFSLALDLPERDLPIQDGSEPLGPLSDFSLNHTPNLPLFTPDAGDPDAPLVTPGATPRAPLAVRRPAPLVPRAKPRRETGRIDRDPEPRLALDTQDMPIVPEPGPRPAPDAPVADAGLVVAPAGARLAGGLIDFVLLAGTDLIVVYFTLKIVELPFGQVLTLPMAPLLSFLLLLNGGYLSTFVAAGGQTIGKMAMRIRVVTVENGPLDAATSAVRSLAGTLTAASLGLGYVPALLGAHRCAIHDRLTRTRVVALPPV